MKITILEREEAALVDSIVAKPTKKFKHQYYTIYMRGSLSQYSIWIDDIMIFNFRGPKDFDGCPNGALQINNVLLKSGVHRATCRVYPPYGKSQLDYMSTAQISYNGRGADDFKEQREDEIFVLDAADLAEKISDQRLEGLPYFEMSKLFYAELPFENEGWSKSINLKKYDQDLLKKEINEAYNKIYNLILNRDVDSLRPLFKDFLEMRVKSFYLNLQNRNEDSEWAGFVELIKNQELELLPLPEKAYLNFYADGKMATLLDENGNNIVILADKKDPKKNAALEFKFHKRSKDSPLEII